MGSKLFDYIKDGSATEAEAALEHATGYLGLEIEENQRLRQHLGWLRLYIDGMTEANWKDMRDLMSRQLGQISDLVDLQG